MKIRTILVVFLIAIVSPLAIKGSGVVFAEDSTAEVNKEDVEDLQGKIEEYEDKINELQGRVKTLGNEIEYMDSQINLTELRIRNSIANIAKTEGEIAELTDDIADLGSRIDKLRGAIEYQRQVLASRLRERYKSFEANPFLVLLGTSTFNQLVQKTEYLKVMELQDNKLLDEMNSTKASYEKQKELFEEKKAEEEELKAQLEREKANLDGQKRTLEDQKGEKRRLLEVTQNDEQKYQKLLEEARKELDQITRAVSVLKNQGSEDVKKGQAIGTQGNTGFSYGDHLHFGVYRYGSFEDIDGWDWYYSNYVNPKDVLKKKTVYWDTGCESSGNKEVGRGDWSWPLSNPTISQGFGHTCWSDIYYNGNDHPAYDMYGPYGSTVYAAEDGKAYFCRNCLGDGGNGVFIFHDDDYMTLYWHLQ